MPASTPVQTHIAELKRILLEEGVRRALIYMNHLTGHRFSAMYRFGDNDSLQNVVFYDRENPDAPPMEEIPIEASYCAFVRSASAPFSVTNSLDDSRVDGHPKKSLIKSYTGVPLVGPGGDMFGTVCHFDFDPSPVDDLTIELMEAIGPLLLRYHTAA